MNTCPALLVLGALLSAPLPAEQGREELSQRDIESMYTQACTLLEDYSITDMSSVPLLLESCRKAGYTKAALLLLDVYEGRFKDLPAQPEKALAVAKALAEGPQEGKVAGGSEADIAAKGLKEGEGSASQEEEARKEGCFRYAIYCEKGFGQAADAKAAYRWMRRAALAGLPKAEVEAARYLLNGIGHEKDERRALLMLLKLIKSAPETPNLFFYLGYMCQNGLGLPRPNRTMALKFYEMGAALDDPRACNNLGNLYERGLMVEENSAQALKFYRKAAKLGNKEASVNLQRLGAKEGKLAPDTATPAIARLHNALLRVLQSLPLDEENKEAWEQWISKNLPTEPSL